MVKRSIVYVPLKCLVPFTAIVFVSGVLAGDWAEAVPAMPSAATKATSAASAPMRGRVMRFLQRGRLTSG